jgi:uncharacterized HAD superfamily protein
MKNLETVILDIDGVLADNKSYKDWFDHTGQFDKIKFGKSVPDLPVLDWGRNLANSLYINNYHVVLVTARDGVFREDTQVWLNKNKILYHKLITNDENVSFDEVEEYKMNAANQYNVLMVVEDKPSTVKAYRDNGYTCLQPNHLYGEEK